MRDVPQHICYSHTIFIHTSHHIHHTTYITPCIAPHASHPMHHTPHNTPYTPHITHHTQHITHHTSHPTHHTPHDFTDDFTKKMYRSARVWHPQCENAAICEKVAKCEKNSTLNVKIDAMCEKITLNVKKWGSLNVSNISTLNVLKSTLYVHTLFWRYLWKSNFSGCQISER